MAELTVTEIIANYGHGTPKECAEILDKTEETTLLRWATEKPVLFESVMLGLAERKRRIKLKHQIRFVK